MASSGLWIVQILYLRPIPELRLLIKSFLNLNKVCSSQSDKCRLLNRCPEMYYCWKFWCWEMKYHHESGVESKSFHHKWRGEAESRVMKWFWFNDRRVMIFHFSTPEFSAISFQKFIHWRTIKYFTITISTYTTISGHLFGKY